MKEIMEKALKLQSEIEILEKQIKEKQDQVTELIKDFKQKVVYQEKCFEKQSLGRVANLQGNWTRFIPYYDVQVIK